MFCFFKFNLAYQQSDKRNKIILIPINSKMLNIVYNNWLGQ